VIGACSDRRGRYFFVNDVPGQRLAHLSASMSAQLISVTQLAQSPCVQFVSQESPELFRVQLASLSQALLQSVVSSPQAAPMAKPRAKVIAVSNLMGVLLIGW
jgi:hypothetical protein